MLLLALAACNEDHAHGEGGAHPPHGAAAEGNAAVITHFTERTELFVEFPYLAVGEESPFAAHFTRLSDFKPVEEGRVVVRLT